MYPAPAALIDPVLLRRHAEYEPQTKEAVETDSG
jgi:hypothetical protein